MTNTTRQMLRALLESADSFRAGRAAFNVPRLLRRAEGATAVDDGGLPAVVMAVLRRQSAADLNSELLNIAVHLRTVAAGETERIAARCFALAEHADAVRLRLRREATAESEATP